MSLSDWDRSCPSSTGKHPVWCQLSPVFVCTTGAGIVQLQTVFETRNRSSSCHFLVEAAWDRDLSVEGMGGGRQARVVQTLGNELWVFHLGALMEQCRQLFPAVSRSLLGQRLFHGAQVEPAHAWPAAGLPPSHLCCLSTPWDHPAAWTA